MFSLARKKPKPSAIPLPAALGTVQYATPLLASARRGVVSALSFVHTAIQKMDQEAAEKKVAKARRASPLPPRAQVPDRAKATARAVAAAAEAERADDQGREWCEQRWNYFAGEVSRVGVRAAARAVFSTASRSECALILASIPDAAPARRVRVNPNLEGAWSCSSSPADASPTFEKKMSAHTHRPQPSAKR